MRETSKMKRYGQVLWLCTWMAGAGLASAQNASTAIGGGVGAAAGTAVGQAVGGKSGGVVGAAVGGAVGGAATAKGSAKTGAALGGAVGGAGGAIVGQSVGGKTGAIVGAGVGGAAGATLGGAMTQDSGHDGRRRVMRDGHYVYLDEPSHHDNGKHKGWYKGKGNRHDD